MLPLLPIPSSFLKRHLFSSLPTGLILAVSGALDLQTGVPIVRIASSAAEADPANNVIAPIPGDRASCLAYLAGGEASLPESFDAERGGAAVRDEYS
jgi:hypothetical protein